jgi:tRNA (guanine-N7-)-methyltransferase
VGRKNKLKKFSEIAELNHVLQPAFEEVFNRKHPLSGRWNSDFFGNKNPVVLELGCGKGEYTVGLASRFPNKNFLGVDIKGARIWRGAIDSCALKLDNVGFLRTRIELIDSFFQQNEVEEIWITFPDPQLKKRRNKKRLTGSRFLNLYRNILIDNGIVHLKTDNQTLFEYTLTLLNYNEIPVLFSTTDLYASTLSDPILEIQTHYEKQFLGMGMPIHYLKFILPQKKEIEELPDEE